MGRKTFPKRPNLRLRLLIVLHGFPGDALQEGCLLFTDWREIRHLVAYSPHYILLRALGGYVIVVGKADRAALKDRGIDNTQTEIRAIEVPVHAIRSIQL